MMPQKLGASFVPLEGNSKNARKPPVSPTRILSLNTFAFTVSFAVWLMYGVLLKFLTSHGIYEWSQSELAILMATPILTGSLMRFPVGVLTDKWGGHPVQLGVLLLTAGGAFSVYFADSFLGFLLAGLTFGFAGTSFAVGVAFTSVWFKKENQGFALGVFGAGNAGAALTQILGPKLLNFLTDNGEHLDNWRKFPLVYGVILLATSVIFLSLSENKLPAAKFRKSFEERMLPLKNIRVWRFGFYYVLLFGGFVGLSNWLLNYYVEVYAVSLATAGLLAGAFSLPSSLVRAGGGWLSDKIGARTVMYWVLSACLLGCVALSFKMSLTPFTLIVVAIGFAMGLGMAAVYKHIPTYFPGEVGVVGGVVGVLGGLGGFACPLIFGGLLTATTSSARPEGLWTTSWMFLALLSLLCLGWMHGAIHRQKRSVAAPPPGD